MAEMEAWVVRFEQSLKTQGLSVLSVPDYVRNVEHFTGTSATSASRGSPTSTERS